MKNLVLIVAVMLAIASLGGCAEADNHAGWGFGVDTPFGGANAYMDGNRYKLAKEADIGSAEVRGRSDVDVAKVDKEAKIEVAKIQKEGDVEVARVIMGTPPTPSALDPQRKTSTAEEEKARVDELYRRLYATATQDKAEKQAQDVELQKLVERRKIAEAEAQKPPLTAAEQAALILKPLCEAHAKMGHASDP